MLEENKGLGEPTDEPEQPIESEQPAAVKFENEVSAKIVMPFDLNKLCNYSFSFDVLKEAIEFLAKQQAEMNAQ